MNDDQTKRGPEDQDRVNIHEEHEVRYWTSKWKVTPEQLKNAVHKVGPRAKDVWKRLCRAA
jgi:hypothetical protein